MCRALAALAAGIFVVSLVGCSGGGGGGGGGGTAGPLQYAGNSNAASVTESNAALFAAAATNSADTAEITGAVSGVAPGSGSQSGEGIIDVGRRIAHTVRTLSAKPRDGRPTAAAFDQTFGCDNNPAGTVRIFGDADPVTGVGTFNFTFSNCLSAGEALNGTLTLTVSRTIVGPAPNDIFPTDFVISFGRLSLRGSVNLDSGGAIHVIVDVPTNKETISQSLIALNLDTGRMTKSEATFVDTYDNVRNVNPTLLTHSINGRVFDSTHGFVTIETPPGAELRFTTPDQRFPSGGEVILTGANNRRIQVVPNSPARVTLGLDLDGNGVFRLVRLGWTDLTGPIGSDLRDTDGDGMHNSWETAFVGAVSANMPDAGANPDNDEFINSAEYLGGGNPGVKGSKPELMVAAPVPVVSNFRGGFNSLLSGEAAISSDGTNFLIVSCGTEGGTLGAFGVFISETGRVGTSFSISTSTVCPQRPAVAFDGTNYLVVVTLGDQLVGFGVTPAGVVSAGKPITSSNNGTSNSLPSIAFDGTNYLVAWRNFSGSVPSSIRAGLVNKSGDLVARTS